MAYPSIPLRIPEHLLHLSELKAKQDYVDRATALRQLLHVGAEEYVLRLYAEGRVSLGRAAELLSVSVHDVLALAERHGIERGEAPATLEARSRAAAKQL